ncbi:unnamed protein product [Strongylus vulgaris]|uniref:Uncharacterized protein n=1 Tax=Strongylus vulgaris TaxID=40348 RepID=A0A3P7IPU7_STRVU|nr:unnamed protein product [Strongylus vulgaris]
MFFCFYARGISVDFRSIWFSFQVNYLGREAIFTPEQVLAALLTKLRDIIESQMKDVKKVTDCVITVPSYFTDVQRRAVHAATQYAGLNALRVMNESTAIALTYGEESINKIFLRKQLNRVMWFSWMLVMRLLKRVSSRSTRGNCR